MPETCYHQGKKIILVPGRHSNGKWVCRYVIPEWKNSGIDNYQGCLPGEAETVQEATMAAFVHASKILDGSRASVRTPSGGGIVRPSLR